ncbi:MAG: hypothetical protein ACI88H_002078 [Cocleimonas sp.]|jgi:hypothetical protein
MNKDTRLIKKALTNPDYSWRTIQGIEKETGIPASIIEKILLADDDTMTSSSKNEKGEQLYTSRDTYRKNASPLRRLSSVLRNRGG